MELKSMKTTTMLRDNQRVLLGVAICLIFLLSACGGQDPLPFVQLSEVNADTIPNPGNTSRLPLRVAVAAVISPKATLEAYAPLRDFLADQLGRPVELIQRSTYAEVNDLVQSGAVDMAFVCGGAFVEAERDFGMEILVAPLVNGEKVYFSYIIVPENSPVQKIEDLHDLDFAFTDPLSNSGHLAPSWMLWERGETPEDFFANTIFTNSHDNSIQAVADHLVDSAAVDSLVYDFLVEQDSPVAERVRIIDSLGPFGIPPVVVHPDIDLELRETLLTTLLTMADDPEGRAALDKLYIDRFVLIDHSAYDSLREMAAYMRGWDELP
jgi:phosphonate transport system substrate-binding protein